MYILNKKTKVINECSNNDVIRYCQKRNEEFAVSKEFKDLEANFEINQNTNVQEIQDFSKMKVDELKAFAKENNIDVEGLNKSEMLKVIEVEANGSQG